MLKKIWICDWCKAETVAVDDRDRGSPLFRSVVVDDRGSPLLREVDSTKPLQVDDICLECHEAAKEARLRVKAERSKPAIEKAVEET